MTPNDTPVDTVVFDRNRALFPDDQLAPFWGKHVAWNADGTHILASGDRFEDVEERLRELGIDPSRTVSEYIDHPNDYYM